MAIPFTGRARKAIATARTEAERVGVPYVGVEHLLLGLLADPRDAASVLLGSQGIDLARARAEVERQTARAESETTARSGVTSSARRALEQAQQDALERHLVSGGQDARVAAADTVNLLMGVVRAAEGVSAAVLRALGIEPGDGAALVRRERAGASAGALASGALRGTGLHAASCPSCGRPVRSDWRHCVYCGATLREGCPRCGAPLQHVPGEAFCHECGAQLQPATDSPTVPLEGDEPLGQG